MDVDAFALVPIDTRPHEAAGERLTPAQVRTLRALLPPVGTADRWGMGDPGLPGRLRVGIEEAIGPHAPAVRLRLSKERLTRLDRCEGLFAADVAGERPPFAHTPRSAAGSLLHKALEIEAGLTEVLAATVLLDLASERLMRDRTFGPYWHGLGSADREAVRNEASRAVERFRSCFPPLPLFRRRLAPTAELWLEASFAGGRVSLAGRIDLLIGRTLREGGRVGPGRVLIDLKTGSAWPEHAEDMRLYALLFTLRCGVPPARVATMFVRSGECQVEDVSLESLTRAADRVIGAVHTHGRAAGGHAVELSPGPHCGWCPRRPSCPAAAAAVVGGRSARRVDGGWRGV